MNNDIPLLHILRCPITREQLRIADDQQLDVINQRIVAGNAYAKCGTKISASLIAALVNESSSWMYPVANGIPCLIPGEAIQVNA